MTRKSANTRSVWVHTNIEAPYRFTIKDLSYVPSPDGVAFSAELVHPTLGVVGLIFNEGRGGATTFDTYDRSRFDARELEKFLAASVQDGQPMATGFSGIEALLDGIVSEAEYDDAVDTMRRERQGLIRSFEADNSRVYRGAPIAFTRPLVTRADREQAAAELADSEDRLAENAHWQLFNGLTWVPLLDRPVLTAEETAKQLAEIHASSEDLPGGGNQYVARKRLNDTWHVWGNTMSGTFTLVSDARMAYHGAWCRCERRRPGYTANFQRWDDNALVTSGVVHAAADCRLLLSID
ncbi:hypothetical protein C8D87_11476 [Lentzea atacamensis]|uniref:Uncharacterized protein n=1 Tax=Lentzea atacamensis TaxID=531938 RepID=A0ABX9DYF8_9PSEU|nr:hypothetical protein [Lentzea atacamensis]RAS59464.1 hypothetical protein C8D87_11476 [Lentzea atacamensis]